VRVEGEGCGSGDSSRVFSGRDEEYGVVGEEGGSRDSLRTRLRRAGVFDMVGGGGSNTFGWVREVAILLD
jgi:hypothetical protein